MSVKAAAVEANEGIATAASCGVRGPFEQCKLIKQVARPDQYPVSVHECRPKLLEAMDKCKKVCAKVVVMDEHPMATSNTCVQWINRENLSLKHFKWNVTEEE